MCEPGKTFGFVWGEGSKNYSEMVIRNYLCNQGENLGSNIAGLGTLYAIHKDGAPLRDNRFRSVISELRQIINNGMYVSISFYTYIVIKTHDSESRGQEEATVRDE